MKKDLGLFALALIFSAASFYWGYREGRKQPLPPEKEDQAVFSTVQTCSSVIKSYSSSSTTSSISFPATSYDADPKVVLNIDTSGETKVVAGRKYEIKVIPK